MGLPKISRRTRYIIVIVLILYLLFSVQWNTAKVNHHFYNSIGTVLPSTARVDHLNLKNLDLAGTSNNGDHLMDLRVQLASQFPYDSRVPIPKKVWQTWKIDPSSKSQVSSISKCQNDWKHFSASEEPPYQYQLITDDQMIPLLEQLYGGVPQVIKAFESLPLPILKADFFRYLILYARGGIYSDMDTFPLKPLSSWPSTSQSYFSSLKNPQRYRNSLDNLETLEASEPGFVIGIEADPDRSDWAEWYARRIQFCQWTIQSKSGHPLLRELITNITATTLESVANVKSSIPLDDAEVLKDIADDYNVNMRDKKKFNKNYKHQQKKTAKNTDGTDIMNWTGPGIFSDVIFQYLNNVIQKNDDILIFNDNLNVINKHGSKHDTTMRFYKDIVKNLQNDKPSLFWGFFSLMTEPILVDDIMVLPITSFSPGIRTMGAKEDNDEMAFVKHIFEGSWKD
ncbi:initiation-specific alpha-1,6-mannosyltransferase [Kluyveromyces lactis]|uniref:KLLA0F22220p n=2 Tax=Kluyveromyces lactis TaxID=28985 RepID=F2Z691_KLULA|nr:uncharacterized protein KLLA0_F22220g [Kluyveromyces lactis]CAD21465.1 mannosyltransferase [Kluyveromyces lactis]CAG98780.1 KLLA0F22220p [Kluyveromyces lactis]|eukprot:XP_456072.1 uncharacterized protein KLLA0_F22220g [Kluyveromyces lactis]